MTYNIYKFQEYQRKDMVKVLNIIRLLMLITGLFFLISSPVMAQRGGSSQAKFERIDWLGITASSGAGIRGGKDAAAGRMALFELRAKGIKGLGVQEVEQGSLAERLGLRKDDHILQINKKAMNSLDDIRDIARTLQPGDEMVFSLIRAFRTIEFSGAFGNKTDKQIAEQGSKSTIEQKVEVFAKLGHSLNISSVAFTPDGRYAVSGDQVKTLRLWDVTTGREIRTFRGHTDLVHSVAVSPDGKYVLSGSEDKTLKLWDIDTGREIRTFSGHTNRVNSVAISPDGKYGLSGSWDYTLKLWDMATGREIRTFKRTGGGYTGWIASVAFSADQRFVVSCGQDSDIVIWDMASGREIQRLKGKSGWNKSVAISPDGKYVSSAGGAVSVWDTATGKYPHSLNIKHRVNAIVFSPDGRYLLTGSQDAVNGSIGLWNVETGTEIKTFKGHKGEVMSLAFSPKGGSFISASHDGSIRLWDVNTGREISQFISFTDGEWIAMTPEGYFNASTNGAKYLNVRVGNKVYSIDNFSERFFNPVYVASVLQGKKVAAVADIRKGILTPPDVRITSPAPGREFNTDTLTVTVAARDTGGGIDEIRLYHNGKAIGEDTRAVKIASRGSEAIREYTVSLVDGVNTFRAVGFSKDRTESNPYELVVKLMAPSKDVSLYVFAVGINKYKNPALNLNYAEPDARGITDFFKRHGRGLFKNVDIREIYNEQATKENIVSQLSHLQNINPQDAVLIYLAGHGENINDKWYFIPHELTYPEREEDVKIKGISSDELSEYMKNIKAQKILLLIDACKSGAVLIAFRGFEDRKALSQLSRSTGVHIIAASTKDQFAAEVKELGHGVFTYILLEGLKGKAAGGGETVTVFKLKAYLDEQLPEITKKYKQEAQYPVGDTRGMDFPLVIVK